VSVSSFEHEDAGDDFGLYTNPTVFASRVRISFPCNGYLGHPFEKEILWAVIARLFLSVRWDSAIDPGRESFSFTRENTGVWIANHQGRHAKAA
jgi:hypothetical protein